RLFYEKIKGISHYGGLVMEEFLATGNAIDLFKTYMFNVMMRSQHILDHILLKPYVEGGIFETFLDKVQTQVTENVQVNYEKFDAVVNKYYPYIFSTIEYITLNNMARVIDVNSVANSLKFEPVLEKQTPDFFFKNFIARVLELKNQEELPKQIAYHEAIKNTYKKVQDFGPAFIDGEKIISLKNGMEFNVKDIL
nr:hypothetical protein [Candidatus Sigynarchaeota archaeon]